MAPAAAAVTVRAMNKILDVSFEIGFKISYSSFLLLPKLYSKIVHLNSKKESVFITNLVTYEELPIWKKARLRASEPKQLFWTDITQQRIAVIDFHFSNQSALCGKFFKPFAGIFRNIEAVWQKVGIVNFAAADIHIAVSI